MRNRTAYNKPKSLSNNGTYIYTLVMSLICWVIGYTFSVGYPVYGEVGDTPLWNVICNLLPGKIITYLAGMVLMVSGAFLIQRTNQEGMLIRGRTSLPFVLYILLLSTNPDFFPLKSTSVGMFCLVLAIYELFTSYHDSNDRVSPYSTALLIATGSLLWIHILWFIPLVWYGMYCFRTLNLRTFLASVLGVATIYWILLGWCVWQKDFSTFVIPFSTFVNFRLLSFTDVSILDWLSIIFVAILTIIAALKIFAQDSGDGIRTREFLGFLIIFAGVSFGLFFIYEQSSEEFLGVACLPTSIILAHFFALTHARIAYWMYHFMVITLVVLLFIRLWNSLSIAVV